MDTLACLYMARLFTCLCQWYTLKKMSLLNHTYRRTCKAENKLTKHSVANNRRGSKRSRSFQSEGKTTTWLITKKAPFKMKIVRFILRSYLYFDVYYLYFSDFATDTHTHTQTQNDYCNPRCACAVAEG